MLCEMKIEMFRKAARTELCEQYGFYTPQR